LVFDRHRLRPPEPGRAIGQCFDQAALLAPGEEEYWLNLTRELMELNRYSEVISAVQNGLAANPKSYALHLRLEQHTWLLTATLRPRVCFAILWPPAIPAHWLHRIGAGVAEDGRAEEAASELANAGQKLGPNFSSAIFGAGL